MSMDRLRTWGGLFGGIVLASTVLGSGAGQPSRVVLALFVLAATWWITEAIPPAMTALVVVALTVVLGVATPKEAFGALGNPVLFLFVGSFMIAEAMRVHGLGERFAHGIARVARGRLGALMATSFAAWALSWWTSNVAATAVVLPIALSVAAREDDRRFSAAIVLSIAFGASMGGLATPVGTPPNLIGLRAIREQLGADVPFLSWMAIGVPIAFVMLLVLWLVLALVFRVRPGTPVARVDVTRKAWTRGEVASAVVFGLAIVGWTGPALLDLAGVPGAAQLQNRLPEEVVALLAATVLFVWPMPPDSGRRAALTWDDATRIDWGTVLLFGGGVLLGDLAHKTGLAKELGELLLQGTGATSALGIESLAVGASILLSELASNTASATLMVPLAIALAQAAGTAPAVAALAATMGASFGFMMPISTAPNAMAYGTGRVTMRQMALAGVFFDVVGFFVVVALVRLLAPALL